MDLNAVKVTCLCSLHVIMQPEHLEEIIGVYEKGGHFDALIALMEQGLGTDNAHDGIFTEFALVYTEYKPETLMERLRVYVLLAPQRRQSGVKACESARASGTKLSICTPRTANETLLVR